MSDVLPKGAFRAIVFEEQWMCPRCEAVERGRNVIDEDLFDFAGPEGFERIVDGERRAWASGMTAKHVCPPGDA